MDFIAYGINHEVREFVRTVVLHLVNLCNSTMLFTSRHYRNEKKTISGWKNVITDPPAPYFTHVVMQPTKVWVAMTPKLWELFLSQRQVKKPPRPTINYNNNF